MVTTSVWPMTRIGFFLPDPLMRATRLARLASPANTWYGMPSLSSTRLRYSTARVSLPGGLLVSMRDECLEVAERLGLDGFPVNRLRHAGGGDAGEQARQNQDPSHDQWPRTVAKIEI